MSSNKDSQNIEILEVKRNEEDLHFPIVITKELGEINLPVQVGKRFLNGSCEEWQGQQLEVIKRVGRKYTKYFIDLEKFNLSDYKEWKIKEIEND